MSGYIVSRDFIVVQEADDHFVAANKPNDIFAAEVPQRSREHTVTEYHRIPSFRAAPHRGRNGNAHFFEIVVS